MSTTTTAEITEVEAVPIIDEQIKSALATYDPVTAGLEELRAKAQGLTIEGIDDDEGFALVSTVRKEAKAVRVAVEHRRKALKADSVKYGKAVDGRAKEITALILEIEEPLHEQEQSIKEQRAARKAEEEAAAAKVLDDRVAALQAVGATVPVSTVIDWNEETFEEMLAGYTARHEKAEAERIEKERQEAEERAKAEAEDEAARKVEEAARAAREAEAKAKREAAEAKLAAEREALDKERAKLDAEKAEAQRAKNEAEAEERAKREAALKAEREAELAAKREKEAAELKARQEAARPDAEKIRGLALDLQPIIDRALEGPEPKRVERILDVAQDSLRVLADSLDGGTA